MSEKTLKTRIVHKHDTEANWSNSTLTPLKGEIIIYDIDSNHTYERFKIGDGVKTVNALPFVLDGVEADLDTLEKSLKEFEAELGRLVGDEPVADKINEAMDKKADVDHDHTEYENQSAFSNIAVGNIIVEADSPTDTISLVAGDNVDFTVDLGTDKITIAATDTVYTHPVSGVTAGWYNRVMVDDKGHVASGSNPTTLSGYGITDAAAKGHAHTNYEESIEELQTDVSTLTERVGDEEVSVQIANAIAESKEPQVQSDWNNNATGSPAYIQNRPFYAVGRAKVDRTILPSMSIECVYDAEIDMCIGKYDSPLGLGNLQEYQIIFDGTTYNEISYKASAYEHIGLGNANLFGSGMNSNLPFAFLDSSDSMWLYTNDKTTTMHTVTIIQTYMTDQFVTIDSRYLPDSVGVIGSAEGAEAFNTFNGSKISPNRALGKYSHAEGDGTTASGDDSHSEGNYTTASGQFSHSEGSGCEATGSSSHAEGNGTIASGNVGAHAEGMSTTASGRWGAHAEGYKTTASGASSHAEGEGSISSGTMSHAEGLYTEAIGAASHAEGHSVKASGEYSHAEGDHTESSGKNSHTEGEQTIAASDNQHVQGRWNIEDSTNTYAHIVGNGGEYNDSEGFFAGYARSNAHTLDWNGNAWYQGDIKIGGTGYTDTSAKTLATAEYVNEYVDGQIQSMVGDKKVSDQINEAIDNITIPEQVQVDWNSNDTSSPSYIKNRPFYAVGSFNMERPVIENQSVECVYDAEVKQCSATISGYLSPSQNYRIILDSKEYNEISYRVNSSTLFVGLGNANLFGYFSDSSLPFALFSWGDGDLTLYTQDTTTTTHTISIIATSYIDEFVELDRRYLPDSVGVIGSAEGAEAFNSAKGSPISINKALGTYSHAEGHDTTASGDYSHSEGYLTTASGDSSHAEGMEATASGAYSHAEGNRCEATGGYSHAEGFGTMASGTQGSHAEGMFTTASGRWGAHAEGYHTTSSGIDGSHAEGYYTTASGRYGSHAEGRYTIAASQAQHVQGKYNVSDSSNTYVHIVGNGESETVRSNAHTLDWDGNAWFKGDVKIGGSGYDDSDATTLITAGDMQSYVANQITEKVGDKNVSDQISDAMTTKADASKGNHIASASSSNGVTYTVNIPEISTLATGTSFIMIPSMTSISTTPELSFNGSNYYTIYRKRSSGAGSLSMGGSPDWFAAGRPIRMMYYGSYWIAESYIQPSAEDLEGIVQIEKGGTGGASKSEARYHLGINSGTELPDPNGYDAGDIFILY